MKKKVLCVILAFLMVTVPVSGCSMSSGTAKSASAVRQVTPTGAKWDLTKVFADSGAFDAAREEIETVLLPEYTETAKHTDTAKGVLAWLKCYDKVNAAINKIIKYATGYYLDGSNSEAVAQNGVANRLQQKFTVATAIAEEALSKKDPLYFEELLSDADLAPWYRQIENIRDNIPHLLTEKQASLVQPSVQAMSDLTMLSDTLLNTDLKYRTFKDANGKEVKGNYANNKTAGVSGDRDLRQHAYNAFFDSLSDYKNTFAANYNAFVGLNENMAKIQGYQSSLDEAMQNYGLTTDDFFAFLDATQNYTDLEARYNALRKKILGLKELDSWDLNAPLCKTPDTTYTLAEAQALMEKAFAPLGNKYLEYLDRAFNENWIDADPGENKTTGAFTQLGYGMDPLILTNYNGSYASVSALAHELGHAINSCMINDAQQSSYNANINLIYAEVTSTTNELLLVRYMEEHAKSEQEKLYYLFYELDLFRANYLSGIYRSAFESDMHQLVQNGKTLTADTLCSAYMASQEKFSPGVTAADNSGMAWAYVTQFYQPYYSCAYSFAIAGSCTAVQGVSDGAGTKNYLDFLSAGNSMNLHDTFALLGAKPGAADYSQPLYDRYSEILDTAEKLSQ